MQQWNGKELSTSIIVARPLNNAFGNFLFKLIDPFSLISTLDTSCHCVALQKSQNLFRAKHRPANPMLIRVTSMTSKTKSDWKWKDWRSLMEHKEGGAWESAKCEIQRIERKSYRVTYAWKLSFQSLKDW